MGCSSPAAGNSGLGGFHSRQARSARLLCVGWLHSLITDERLEEYARLLVERCIGVQPGWQVLVRAQPLARPLLEEVVRLVARAGAYALVRLNWSIYPWDEVWAAEAPLELVRELAPIDSFAADHMDARISIEAPENVRGHVDLSAERRAMSQRLYGSFSRRTRTDEIPWVECMYPTQALAQEAGMTLGAYKDFLYGACLRDWDEETRSMEPLLERFDAAEEVRIVGRDTDLRLSLRGRCGEIDSGQANIPGGEFFFSPLEDSADGTVYFDVPSSVDGAVASGIRLRFAHGRVEEASAERGEDVLLAALETDAGARYVGELGIGCNAGITRATGNILFDEKIAGTVNVAIGGSYPSVGGTNVSDLHWDLIKDLREGGRIELDGEVVQQDGAWLM
jgi:aminopeptidase